MRSPYERQPRFRPARDDLDNTMRRLDPTGERAAAELDRERRRLRSRTPDPEPPPARRPPKPNPPPSTDWSGALTFSDKGDQS